MLITCLSNKGTLGNISTSYGKRFIIVHDPKFRNSVTKGKHGLNCLELTEMLTEALSCILSYEMLDSICPALVLSGNHKYFGNITSYFNFIITAPQNNIASCSSKYTRR